MGVTDSSAWLWAGRPVLLLRFGTLKLHSGSRLSIARGERKVKREWIHGKITGTNCFGGKTLLLLSINRCLGTMPNRHKSPYPPRYW